MTNIKKMRDPIEVALEDLQSPKAKARAAAADALGQLASQEGFLPQRPHVIEALRRTLRDADASVRYHSVLSLAEIKSLEAKNDIAELMRDPDVMVRQGSVIALGELGDASVAPILEEAWKTGPPEVRFQALASLVALLNEEARPYLQQALQDPDGEVRAQAIGGLNDLIQEKPALAAELVRAVKPYISDLYTEARFEAALLLSRARDLASVPVLLEFAKDKSHGLDACEALGLLGDTSVVPQLRKVASGFFTSAAVSMRAAQAIVRLSPRDADREREMLQKQAKKNNEIRPLAIMYIAELAEDEGLLFLCRMLQNEREPLALSIVDSLAIAYSKASSIAKSQIIDSLKWVEARHQDKETRDETVIVLSKLSSM
jgi:HEAT repeat protein